MPRRQRGREQRAFVYSAARGLLFNAAKEPQRPALTAARTRLRPIPSGRMGARAVLAELAERAAAEYVAPTLRAKILFALGETDAGFAALDQAREERDQSLSYLKVDPNYAIVQHDPRYALLLARLGL